MDNVMDKEVMEVVASLKGATIKETLIHVGEMSELQAITLMTTDGKQIFLSAKAAHQMEVFVR